MFSSVNRRPLRTIKRKKFEGEVVDSHLDQIYLSRNRQSIESSSLPSKKQSYKIRKRIQPSSSATISDPRIKRKRNRLRSSLTTENMSWRPPADDVLLITAVMQLKDLDAVARAVKFSSHVTKAQLEARWFSILYDANISEQVKQDIATLPFDVLLDLMRRAALFSAAEEDLLKAVPSTPLPSDDVWRKLLNAPCGPWHETRNERDLKKHWLKLKHFHLLNDQSVSEQSSFSDMEENCMSDVGVNDSVPDSELETANMRNIEEIRRLEAEIPRWSLLADIAPQDKQILAVLRGRHVRFLVQSRQVSIGRGPNVDIDLSLEGPASAVSRLHAYIRLNSKCKFYILCHGRRTIYVDGMPVVRGERQFKNSTPR